MQDSDLLALGSRDDADRTDQFVFDGQAAVDEGDDDLFGAAGEGDAEDDVFDRLAGLVNGEDGAGGDAEAGLGLRAWSLKRSVGISLSWMRSPPTAWISLSMLSRSDLVCTNSGGTSGL